ncbi:MAG: hypothetical protein ABI175_25470, partial [Polyangiales bacterium]
MKTIGLLALFLVGCTSDPKLPGGDDVPDYPTVPEEAQRTGDPAKGKDYLLNGGYITCGIPKSVYDTIIGPASPDQMVPGRTGDNAMLPFNFGAATSSEGVKVVSANCLQCHAGRINGQIVVGLGASDADFTSDQASQLGALANLQMAPAEKTEVLRFI